ncbi:hypothetical protein PMAYCL1PPCAC_18343, partial [Pristionchus mayeri]
LSTPFPFSTMNMVRIRRIMEMRKELAAPPLLPPKLKKSSLEAVDKSPRDIVIFHFQLRNSTISFPRPLLLSIHESESGGREGPWKLSAFSDRFELPLNDFVDLPSVFSIQFEFEIVQPMKIELCIDKEDSPIAFCIFSLSQVINTRRLTLPFISPSRGEEVAILDITFSLKFPPPPFQIQFEVRDLSRKFISDSSTLSVLVHEIREGNESFRSEAVRVTNSRINWRPFCIFIGDELEVIIITLLLRDEKSKSELIIGETQTTLSQLERDCIEGKVYQLNRRGDGGEGRRVIGLLEPLRVSPLPIHSFLHFISSGTSLHLSFAIDFSSPNEEEISSCLSLDAEFIIRSIGGCVEDYLNKSISALGFAGRIPPVDRESQQFCLSLDTNPYCDSVDSVVSCLHGSMEKVLPSRVAHLSHVIYYVSKLAIHANLRRSTANTQYFILVIVTRGAIDDLKEVVQAVIFASKAPISILFVGMGERKKDELDRLGRGGTRISYQGRRVTRDLVNFIDLKEVSRKGENGWEDGNSLSEAALSRVPSQLTAYLSKTTSSMRNPSRSRGFGSMTSVDSEQNDEKERRSRMEYGRRRRIDGEDMGGRWTLPSAGDPTEEEERRGRSPERSSHRCVSSLVRDVRSMSIASEKEERIFRKNRHDFPTF